MRVLYNSLWKPLVPKSVLFAAYLILAFILLRRFIFGQATFFGCCDASVQAIAWLNKVADAARQHTLSLWDFPTYSGVSFAGELQPAPFYPVTILLGLLGFKGLVLANVFIFAHIAVGLISMHLLIRALGGSTPAAFVGSILYNFCGFTILQSSGQHNLYAGLALFPLLVLFFYKACQAKTMSRTIAMTGGVAAAGAAQILAGHLTPFIYSSYALILFAVTRVLSSKSDRWRPLLVLFFGFAGVACIACVPIWLSLEYLQRVYRWFEGGISVYPHRVPLESWKSSGILLWPDFATLFNPYGTTRSDGATLFITVAGLLVSPFSLLRPRAEIVWLWIVIAFAIIVALSASAGFVANVTYQLPFLAQTRTPIRSLFLYNFAAAAVVAFGIDAIAQLSRRFHAQLPLLLTGIVAAIIMWEVAVFSNRVGMPTTLAQEGGRYYDHDPALDALIRVSNDGPLVDRFIAVPEDVVPPNAGDVRPVLNVFGHRGTMLISYVDFIGRDWTYSTSRSFDELGARWVVSNKPMENLRLLERGDGYFLYERPNALSVLWMKENSGPKRAPVQRVSWFHNSVIFWLTPDSTPHRVIFSQPSYPSWKAYVDGKETAIGSEDIFPAVDLPLGARKIEFDYRPNLLIPILITLLGLLCWLAALIGSLKRPGLFRKWRPVLHKALFMRAS